MTSLEAAMAEPFDRYLRPFRAVTVAQAWDSRRAIVGAANMPPGELYDRAERALDQMRNNEMPSAADLAALELTIRMLRPAPLSRDGRLEDLPAETAAVFPDWDRFRAAVAPLLPSVGRIDDASGKMVGTGFRVAARLLVTNTHVLAQLSGGAMRLEKGQAVVRFRREYGTPDEPPVDLVGVREVHPSLDIALLELADGQAAGRPPLQLAPEPVAVGTAVVAVGYPDEDRRNPLFVSALFGDRFRTPVSIRGIDPRKRPISGAPVPASFGNA
jgi:S1-C subfamily serine protease